MEAVWTVDELRDLLVGHEKAAEVSNKKILREMARLVFGEEKFEEIERRRMVRTPIDAFEAVARGLPVARVAPLDREHRDVFGITWRAVNNLRTKMVEWHLVVESGEDYQGSSSKAAVVLP